MNELLRKVRGALGIAATWGAGWMVIGTAVGVVVGIAYPGTMPQGDGPFGIGVMLGVLGTISGFGFGIVMSLTERRRSIDDLSIGRAALWGAVGAAALPLLTTMSNSLALIACPLGAIFAATSVALARRGRRAAPLLAASDSNRAIGV